MIRTREKKIEGALLILILASALTRAFLAAILEFGNDEVYYWTYALFPALSHFDHPPMVGLVIQLFTLNHSLDSEFFIRLGSVVLGSCSTVLIYAVGKKIKDPLTGLYAAFLYTSSFYCFVISSTFIMPDSPQVFFWLLALYFLVHSLTEPEITAGTRTRILLAGVAIGLALLSKYHSVFLILGVFLYMLFYDRRWFRVKEVYIAFGIACLFCIPILVWNWQNHFISFTYHESRIQPGAHSIRWDYLGTEMIGQFFYNNPVNFIIILAALATLFFGKRTLEKPSLRLLLWTSLPLAIIFPLISLREPTLPHWTGPAYLGLILVSASFLRGSPPEGGTARILPWPVITALSFMAVFIILGTTQIRYGWIPLKGTGAPDISADLYGWRQLGQKFGDYAREKEGSGKINPGSPILTFRWFPAANFDYYLARPLHKKVYALGSLERIHKYYWIGKIRGPVAAGSDAYFITSSDDLMDPVTFCGDRFTSIIPPDTIPITRNGETIRRVYIYILKGLKEPISFEKANPWEDNGKEK